MSEIWMMSNRQPWVEALLQGWINGKTRSLYVNLPPVGAIVYLHASKALWSGWRDLWWTKDIDVKGLDCGGVVGKGKVIYIGMTSTAIACGLLKNPHYWDMPYRSCADDRAIIFSDVERLPFIPCRGSLVPTRKLPQELLYSIGG